MAETHRLRPENTEDKVPSQIRIFIACPEDAADYRKTVEEVAKDLNKDWVPLAGLTLETLNWRESVIPWFGKPAEAEILEQLPVKNWDFFIAILWHHIGHPTDEIDPVTKEPFYSGTHQEFVLAHRWNKKFGIPKMLIYRINTPVCPNEIDPSQLLKVNSFFKEFDSGGKYSNNFKTPIESKDKFREEIEDRLRKALLDMQVKKSPSPSQPDEEDIEGLAQWLIEVGFERDPFAFPDAEDDTSLYKYFHDDFPYAEHVIGGITGSEVPMVIFGERGSGKTAFRRKISHVWKYPTNDQKVLTVEYIDFSILRTRLESGLKITVQNHVEQLIFTTLQELSTAISQGSLKIREDCSDEQRIEFARYSRYYGRDLSVLQAGVLEKSLQLTKKSSAGLRPPKSPVLCFRQFCESLRIFSLDKIFYLIDKIDEGSQGVGDKFFCELIEPLMSELSIIDDKEHRVIFRFFLPSQLEALLRGKGVRVGDKIQRIPLKWEDRDLQAIISRRLSQLNTKREYKRMAELSNIADLDARLIRLSDHNPRRLIQLCQLILHEHCRSPISRRNILLNEEDFRNAKKRYETDYPITDLLVEGDASSFEEQRNHNQLKAQSEQGLLSKAKTRQSKEPELDKPTRQVLDFMPHFLTVPALNYLIKKNPTERQWKAFELVQSILSFIACSMIMIYLRSEMQDQSIVTKLREQLFKLGDPASLGRYWDAAQLLISARKGIHSPLFLPFVKFRTKKTETSLERIISKRNAASHGKGGEVDIVILDGLINLLIAALEPISYLQVGIVMGLQVDSENLLIHKIRTQKGNAAIPGIADWQLDGHYQQGHMLLADEANTVCLDLWPLILFQGSVEPEVSRIEREIWIYDQIIKMKNERIVVQYRDPISQSTFRSEVGVQFLRDKGLV